MCMPDKPIISDLFLQRVKISKPDRLIIRTLKHHF